MKKSILFLIITISFTICNAQNVLIGNITGGNGNITVSDSQILLNWNVNVTNFTGINPQLTSVSLVNTSNGWILQATGAEYSSSTNVIIQGTDVFAPSGSSSVTCTTKSCAQNNGCRANPVGNNCTQCTGDCTKTTSEYSIILNNLTHQL